MGSNEPRQAVLDYLGSPWPRTADGLRDPLDRADPASIQFGRAVTTSGRWLQVVHYTDLHGNTWHYVLFLCQGDDGCWHVEGGGGGGGLVTRSYPSLNLAAGWGAFGLWAGGQVSDGGTKVTRARLLGPDGLVVEDAISDGYALFMTNQPVHDLSLLSAELFNEAGDLVGSHKPFAHQR